MRCCCFGIISQPRCQLCDTKLDPKINTDFCSRNCEMLHMHKDSFKSSNGSEHKLVVDL